MGKKRTGAGKYIFLCTALLTCLLTASCVSLDSSPVEKSLPQDEVRQHLVLAQKLLVQNNYEAALEENQKVLSIFAGTPPADEALYSMALIYAHPGNPKRDYVKSIATFKRLIKEYPQSTWTEQAKIWVQVIQESENAKRVAATLTQQNDKLKQTAASLSRENDKLKRESENAKRVAASLSEENDKLKQIIEQSKKVDIEIEEKKKEAR